MFAVDDQYGPLRCIADLIEGPSPRATLQQITNELNTIAKMAKAARAMLHSATLSQPDTHGIFTQLSERMGYKNYAFATLNALLESPNLPASIAKEARTVIKVAKHVDEDLKHTLLQCYLTISKPKSDLVNLRDRKKLSLAELSKNLQNASHDLTNLVHMVAAVAAMTPLPFTKDQLEKGRADLRHNRGEIALAAAQIPISTCLVDTNSKDTLLAARAAIDAIANTLDVLEVAYKDIETRLDNPTTRQDTVH